MDNIFTKLLIVAIVGIAIAYFGVMPYLDNTMLQEDIEFILKNQSKLKSAKLKSKKFSKLPPIVKKYLRKSIKDDSHLPVNCKFEITGKMKKTVDGEWIETSSQNYYSTTTSDFLNFIEEKTPKLLWTTTINKYINNKASTESKLVNLFSTYSFEGNKLNRSYLVLYLLESVFCPTVLLPNMNIHWKKIDKYKAKATIWDNNMKGTAIFYFNQKGEVLKVVTEDRYMPGNLDYNRETFTLHLANYKDVGNYYIPTYFEYEWNLASGNFTFGRFQILDISFNLKNNN